MKKIILASILASGVAFAGHTNTGCGLGNMLIKDQSTTLMQTLAFTTNATSGNQSFGITSGTLGCEKPANFAANEKLQNFVADNMDTIASDASKGNGEALYAVAEMMNIKDKAAFSAKVQANFDKIFVSENTTSAQVIDNIANIAS